MNDKKDTREVGGFIDTARVYLKAGMGGDGCSSFRREKYIPYGGPDGGNGGKGGDIWFVATANINTLTDVACHPHVRAHDGGNGKGKNLYGRGGEDAEVLLPAGTVVKLDGKVMVDLKDDGQRWLAAKGGRGGRGNVTFKTHFNTAPRISERGEPGDELTYDLELSLLADVGLAGFPNAGKSTFLSRVSAARPKIADYPFTTLNPNLGVVNHKGKYFVVADIPGIIEGAHDGKGLGIQFLKHIFRTKLILHIVDPLGFGGCTPAKAVKIIDAELESYSPELAGRERLLVINKADLPEAEKVFKTISKGMPKGSVFLISAVTGKGVPQLLDRVAAMLPKLKAPEVYSPEMAPDRGVHKPLKRGFEIKQGEDGIFEVHSQALHTLVVMANFTQPESVDRLKKTFKTIGLNKALKKAGVVEGTTVRIGGKDFEWSDREAPYQGKAGKFAYKYKPKSLDE